MSAAIRLSALIQIKIVVAFLTNDKFLRINSTYGDIRRYVM